MLQFRLSIKYQTLLFSTLFTLSLLTAQKFEAIPANVKSTYAFNFKKNFYAGEADLAAAEGRLLMGIDTVIRLLQDDALPVSEWKSVLHTYDRIEREYRKLDLYYFLKYATNTKAGGASEEDKIRKKMNEMRQPLKARIAALPEQIFEQLIKREVDFAYFLRKVRTASEYVLSDNEILTTSHFSYLKNSEFYDKALQRMEFEPIYTVMDTIDPFIERSSWESNTDPAVRSEGEEKFFAGHATEKQSLGYGYIHYIRGLNAFAQAKGYRDLLEEKYDAGEIPPGSPENFFTRVLDSQDRDTIFSDLMDHTPGLRFDIFKATEIIEKSLKVLGPEYAKELRQLLNPDNGRIDIAGGENRLPLRGAASVYPVFPSIFYAMNYEGYLIDLTLMAHEAGHAVQASMMYINKVRMVNGAGPAYFTESFGNFNELLTYDYLYRNAKNPEEKEIFRKQLNQRLKVIYGSTEEAFIEYYLVKGILDGTISSPEDLDRETHALGMRIHPEYYSKESYRKGLWMLLDTSFREPFHNIHEMMASALSINYYLSYRKNPSEFIPKYLTMLNEGYENSAYQLLLRLGIDLTDEDFAGKVLQNLPLQKKF